MSVLTEVSAACKEYERIHGEDDIDFMVVLNALPDEKRKLWHKECELERDLRPEYGTRPDFDEILEREIYARGLEAK